MKYLILVRCFINSWTESELRSTWNNLLINVCISSSKFRRKCQTVSWNFLWRENLISRNSLHCFWIAQTVNDCSKLRKKNPFLYVPSIYPSFILEDHKNSNLFFKHSLQTRKDNYNSYFSRGTHPNTFFKIKPSVAQSVIGDTNIVCLDHLFFSMWWE